MVTGAGPFSSFVAQVATCLGDCSDRLDVGFSPNFQAVRHKPRVYLSTSNFLDARPEYFERLCLRCRRNGLNRQDPVRLQS